MNSQRIAGTLGAIVAAAVLALAFYSTMRSGADKPAVQKVEPSKAPVTTPPVKGPVVRDIPQ
jgi:hypothetical protein